jgi:hypothetical protein
MNDARAIWRGKSDDDVAAAAEALSDYTEEGEQIIRAELRRRGLVQPPPPIGQCAGCGRSLHANDPGENCAQCGEPHPREILAKMSRSPLYAGGVPPSMFGFRRRKHRGDIRQRPFPPEWAPVLERQFPLFRSLPAEDQEELKSHILVFLEEKRFEGCGGLAITDEIRLSIAAQACLLLLHRESEYFSKLSTILVYPSTYVAPQGTGPGGTVVENDAREGESWQQGYVVLSWDGVRAGAMNSDDGWNLVFHEFAHQLDQEDGAADGAPVLTGGYAVWARVLGEEYQRLQQGQTSLLDDYGATNPAEFFAVATEAFFEKPRAMKDRHPELYKELSGFYQQDPILYVPNP